MRRWLWSVALALLLVTPAAAQSGRIDCKGLGLFVRHVAYLREMGARLPLVVAEIRKTPPGLVRGATRLELEREALRVWHAGLDRERAEESGYMRCVALLGELEEG